MRCSEEQKALLKLTSLFQSSSNFSSKGLIIPTVVPAVVCVVAYMYLLTLQTKQISVHWWKLVVQSSVSVGFNNTLNKLKVFSVLYFLCPSLN